MKTLTRRPIQVYLEESQDRILRAAAKSQGISIAELIRRSVDRYLADLPVEDDPAMRLIALGRSGLGDLAEKHDEYLVRWEKGDNQA